MPCAAPKPNSRNLSRRRPRPAKKNDRTSTAAPAASRAGTLAAAAIGQADAAAVVGAHHRKNPRALDRDQARADDPAVHARSPGLLRARKLRPVEHADPRSR